MDFGIASVAAVTVICYLVGLTVKTSGLDNKYIPAIVGGCGGLLGVAGSSWGRPISRPPTRRRPLRWALAAAWRPPGAIRWPSRWATSK